MNLGSILVGNLGFLVRADRCLLRMYRRLNDGCESMKEDLAGCRESWLSRVGVFTIGDFKEVQGEIRH